jgi:uncharacterized membrane protein YbaN (DUF454 family)
VLLLLRISIGAACFILGIVGLLLPVMQGWLFFLLAALILFPRSRFAIVALEKAEPRVPRVVAVLRRLGGGGVRREAAPARERAAKIEN